MDQQRFLLNAFWKGVTTIALLGLTVACKPAAEMEPIGFDGVEIGSQKTLSATDLEGTKWILFSYGPSETPVKSLSEPEVTIKFHDYKIMHGMAGCNTYTAQFDIEGHQFGHSDIEHTPFGCQTEAEWEQETKYLSALATAGSIGLVDGLLTIQYEGGQLRFEPQPAHPGVSLAGTHWRLISFKSVDSAEPAIPSAMITAAFIDGEIMGTAGCNAYKGAFVTEKRSFTIWEIIKGTDPCPGEGVLAQERRYIQALHSADSFSLEDNILAISFDDGTLRFGKSPPLDDTFATEWLNSNAGEKAQPVSATG